MSGHTCLAGRKTASADFLTKPVDGAVLLERVQAALSRSCELLDRQEGLSAQHQRLTLLTPREREVMLLVAGHPNKAIANRLGISYRTVELHRSHILQKTGTTSMLELARLAADCGLTPHSL